MVEIRGNDVFLKTLRVALVHDWLTGMRGGEKCLEVFCEIFPQADIFTLFYFPGTVSPTIESHPIHTTWVQHLPFLAAKYRNYLPLFPLALEGLSFKGYDLVLSSSHCVAKAARAPSPAKHISYVFTPIRYVWDMYDIYFGRESNAGRLPKLLMPWIAPLFRKWDVRTCRRVDHFLADSDHVRKRIRRYYQREAEVIPVPVDTDRFSLAERPREYYLMVTALAPYKRVDLAVRAFNRLGFPLIIVGTGPLRERLQAESEKNITWFGWADSGQLKRLYGECRALIFPGEEDAGITPLEAQASGRPVVAYGVGGALETIVPLTQFQTGDKDFFSGVFFYQQTEEALLEAVRTLEEHLHLIQSEKLRSYARTFDREVFKRRIIETITSKLKTGV